MKTQNETPAKDVALGQLRETLAIVGSLFFGATTGWESITGLVVAIAAVAWGFWKHEGKETIFSSMRKVLSIAPGVAVACGLLPAKFEPILVSMLVPLLALVWSYKANGGKKDIGKGAAALLVFLCVFSLSSCGSNAVVVDIENDDPDAIRGAISGLVVTTDEKGKLKPKVDRKTLIGWLGKVARIAAGEDVKEVILDTPPPSGHGFK